MRLRTGAAIDLHDVAGLRGARARALVLRLALVAAAVGFAAAAAISARGLDPRAPGLLPTRSTGVVVLDLSLSIVERDYPRVAGVVRRLIAADAPVGLVAFSDAPYELLPPGTPARELRPLLRVLTTAAGGRTPQNPWADAFRSGTVISSALELAAQMLEREHVTNGSILLVSDLETAPEDVPKMVRVLRDLRARGFEVRVVPLSPLGESRQLFASLLGADAFSEPEPTAAASPRRPAADARADLPSGLLVLGALVFLALAAHERFGARLALPSPREARS